MAAIPPQFLKNAKASSAPTSAPAASGNQPPWLAGKGTAPKLDPKRKKKARSQAIADVEAKASPTGGSQPPWLKGK